MAYKKEKNDIRMFQTIPSLDDIQKFNDYKKIINKASNLKEQLKIAVKEHTKVRNAHIKYLQDNPHRKNKKMLERKINEIKAEFFTVIPDKYQQDSRIKKQGIKK